MVTGVDGNVTKVVDVDWASGSDRTPAGLGDAAPSSLSATQTTTP